MAPFYITTAIDYANGEPHLGHAFEKIGADAIARYHRLRADQVHFLIGMDEHGQKVSQSAAERGVTPQAFADEIAGSFRRMWDRLAISYDQFIRTTEPGHKAGVRTLIERIAELNPDDFYEKSYEGWYCVGCELFKRDSEIVDGRCVLHPTRTLEWTEERNWFFRLTRYQAFLAGLLRDRPEFLQPESRRNEILRLIEGGLEDISVTRSGLDWAIPFPLACSNGEHQGTWVWFDALPNYLTATGYPAPGFETRWPAQLHVIGKDITRLHCVVWPAMLEAAELALPERVWAHGFVSLGGERMSKSAGVKLDLGEAIDRFGPDAFRYFLLREIPFDGDGNFSWERFEDRYNADLANAFGNLASRTIAMVERYCAGVVPAAIAGAPDEADSTLGFDVTLSLPAYHAAMESCLLHDALGAVWQMIGRANEYVDRKAPWKLAKDPTRRDDLEHALATLVGRLALHAQLIHPFMPGKAQALWDQLGAPGTAGDPQTFARGIPNPAGWKVARGPSLFPKDQPAPV